MTVAIRNFRFPGIIGLLDFEREAEQEIEVDLEFDYDYRDSDYLDYAQVAETVRDHLRQARYKLLEEALLGLRATLWERYPRMERLACTLTKPHILPHAEVSLSMAWSRGS
jgi:dihydroneopterin aldolase